MDTFISHGLITDMHDPAEALLIRLCVSAWLCWIIVQICQAIYLALTLLHPYKRSISAAAGPPARSSLHEVQVKLVA
jgi:hypothetical protein